MTTQLSHVHAKIMNVYDLKGMMGNTQYIDFLFPNEIPFNKMKVLLYEQIITTVEK